MAKVRRKLDYIKGVMADFSYAKEIRLFGMKDFIAARYVREQKECFEGSMKIQAIWLKAKNLFALTDLVEEAMLYTWLCWRVIEGGMGIGDFTMYAAAIRTFSGALGGLFDDISHIRQQNEIINDFRAFLDYPENNPGSEKLPADLTGLAC
ncbi:MAG: ABC transporter ATP-binding protein [Firmicutes bacterium]|nr:ABC transporter ATP-binding protein [Bacillota bacterium]